MCAACAMAAAAGASGARSWLAARHATWLTPRRMRVVTAALCAVTLGVSTIGLTGSTAAPGAGHPVSERSAPLQVAH